MTKMEGGKPRLSSLYHRSAKSEKVRPHLPPGTGEYSVGCVDIMSHHTKDGSFLRLHYPVTKTDIFKRDKQWPLWLPRKQYGKGYAHFLGRNPKVFGKLINWIGGKTYVPALWQGPLCPNGGKFPVIVFTHGLGGNRTSNTTLCCELASQGFIVAAVEHRDGSASMTLCLKDGHTNTQDCDSDELHKTLNMLRSCSFKEVWQPFERDDDVPWDDYEYRNKQVHHRADECSRVVDIIEQMNDGQEIHNIMGLRFKTSQFKNRIDLSRVAIVGHSFGGSTTVCALSKDKRFRTGVTLDGWMHPLDERVYKDITQSMLFFNMQTFQWTKNIEQMRQFNSEKVDRRIITLLGGCHQTLTDFQFIIQSRFVGKLMEIRHDLSPSIAMDLVCKGTLGFLWKHLDIPGKDLHEDLLDGKCEHVMKGTNVGPNVTLATRKK